jgi:hypothetical protein
LSCLGWRESTQVSASAALEMRQHHTSPRRYSSLAVRGEQRGRGGRGGGAHRRWGRGGEARRR